MKGWRWGVAIAVSAAGVWLALRGVDLNSVRSALSQVRHPWFLLFIPVAGGLEYALRTERWRLVLGEPRALRPALFPVVAGAFFLNNVLPFRAGEAARIYWTHRCTGRPLVGAVAALAVDRLLDSLALVSLFLLALASKGGTSISPGAAWGLLAVGVVGFSFFVLLARRSEKVGRWLDSSRLPEWLRKFLRAFIAGADRYVRAVWTIAGAAPSVTFSLAGQALIVYCTPDEVRALGVAAPALANVAADLVAEHLLTNTDDIDDKLCKRWKLPLTKWPSSLRKHLAAITVWTVLSHRGVNPTTGDTDLQKRHDKAWKDVMDLAENRAGSPDGYVDSTPTVTEDGTYTFSRTRRR
jgi:phage gp36-like protein